MIDKEIIKLIQEIKKRIVKVGWKYLLEESEQNYKEISDND